MKRHRSERLHSASPPLTLPGQQWQWSLVHVERRCLGWLQQQLGVQPWGNPDGKEHRRPLGVHNTESPSGLPGAGWVASPCRDFYRSVQFNEDFCIFFKKMSWISTLQMCNTCLQVLGKLQTVRDISNWSINIVHPGRGLFGQPRFIEWSN